MSREPRVFIGNSAEGREFAYAIQKNLERYAAGTVWDQGLFSPTSTVFHELIRNLDKFDFGIFVLTPDDHLEIRGTGTKAPRDNVIFELGMFAGALGDRRTFIVTPRDMQGFHVPVDLLGILPVTFDSHRADKNWPAALGPACYEMRKVMERLGRRQIGRSLATDGSPIQCAAAICFRRVDMIVEFLLVNSTRARRIFPKGKVRDAEDVRAAAMRYAYAEGGALGHPIDENPRTFHYFKEESREVQVMGAVLIEVTSQTTPRAKFREPKWFDLAAAELEFSRDRDFEHAIELRKLLGWANEQIEKLKYPRIQASILPYRWGAAGLEVLLITSKSHRHWIFPKGNIKFDRSIRESAIEEALEEAGIEGVTTRVSVTKSRYIRFGVEHIVETFAMEVKKEHLDWPEKFARDRKWVTLEEAATIVEYEHLKQTIVEFGRRMEKVR
jgi:8-oxo-dGTP pyrophosphatase MutT (NUDIX family)